MVARGEAKRFGVGHLAQLARNQRVDDALLVLQDANLETLVLGLQDDLVPVKAIERLSRILAGWQGTGIELQHTALWGSTYRYPQHGRQRYRRDADSGTS